MPIGPAPQMRASMFGRMPVGAKPKGGGGGAPAPKGPSGVRIEHRVGIQASPEAVWNVIYDLESWERWNPMYPKAAGEIRIGGKLDLTLALAGETPRQIQPTVLEWVPNEQLHWRTTMLGGFIQMTRYLEIDQLAEASCIVANGEIFGGLMGASFGKRVGPSVHRGFREMNEALKAEAERRWQAAG